MRASSLWERAGSASGSPLETQERGSAALTRPAEEEPALEYLDGQVKQKASPKGLRGTDPIDLSSLLPGFELTAQAPFDSLRLD